MDLEKKISTAVLSALQSLYGITPEATAIQLQKTKKEFEGHYTLVVFPFLKASRKKPEETAQEIGEVLLKNEPAIASFNVIKGFLNLVLAPQCWMGVLKDIDTDEAFGTKMVTADAPLVMVVYIFVNQCLHGRNGANVLLPNPQGKRETIWWETFTSFSIKNISKNWQNFKPKAKQKKRRRLSLL